MTRCWVSEDFFKKWCIIGAQPGAGGELKLCVLPRLSLSREAFKKWFPARASGPPVAAVAGAGGSGSEINLRNYEH